MQRPGERLRARRLNNSHYSLSQRNIRANQSRHLLDIQKSHFVQEREFISKFHKCISSLKKKNNKPSYLRSKRLNNKTAFISQSSLLESGIPKKKNKSVLIDSKRKMEAFYALEGKYKLHCDDLKKKAKRRKAPKIIGLNNYKRVNKENAHTTKLDSLLSTQYKIKILNPSFSTRQF